MTKLEEYIMRGLPNDWTDAEAKAFAMRLAPNIQESINAAVRHEAAKGNARRPAALRKKALTPAQAKVLKEIQECGWLWTSERHILTMWQKLSDAGVITMTRENGGCSVVPRSAA